MSKLKLEKIKIEIAERLLPYLKDLHKHRLTDKFSRESGITRTTIIGLRQEKVMPELKTLIFLEEALKEWYNSKP